MNLIWAVLREINEILIFFEDNISKMKSDEKLYNCINIEDLNDKFVGIKIVLSNDLIQELFLLKMKNSMGVCVVFIAEFELTLIS